MAYALTVKGQVTVPKAIRQHLGVQPGQEIEYEPLPDGSVRMIAAQRRKVTDIRAVLEKLRGTGIAGMTTDEIMRETRGDDWNR
jgi:antitoxin PrlF